MSNNRHSLIKDKIKCSCKGYNLDKLIQPQILALLNKHHQELHGYRIIELLNEKAFLKESIDSTGAYRTLKLMEARKLLAYDWDTSGTGPAKKMYRITDAGKECLLNWIKTLKKYQNSIDQILKDYEI